MCKFCLNSELAVQVKSLEIMMAFDTNTEIAAYSAPEKDLYDVGEMPPLGYVPKSMYAWAIRR